MLEASDLVVLQSTKSHIMVRNEETLLIAEYRVSMLSGGNLTNLMEQVKRARFCCPSVFSYLCFQSKMLIVSSHPDISSLVD